MWSTKRQLKKYQKVQLKNIDFRMKNLERNSEKRRTLISLRQMKAF